MHLQINKFAKKIDIKLLLIACSLAFVSGCGVQRAVYGVSAQEWEQMTEAEQQATKQRFEEQQQLYQATREQAAQAKQEAEALQEQCQNATEAENEECRVITRHRIGF